MIKILSLLYDIAKLIRDLTDTLNNPFIQEILDRIYQVIDDIERMEKEREKKRQEFIKALASGDSDSINRLIAELLR